MASSSKSTLRKARTTTTTTQYLENKGGFLTAHILGQPYGEISPKFIREFYEELEPTLTVFDSNNRSMDVQFNGSIEHPMIVFGWIRMRRFFGINGNKLILMTYVGRSRFLMQIMTQDFNPNNLPSWHSYRTFHTDLTSFDVTLTPYLVSGSQLTLKKDFAAYIRNCGYNNLVLYGPAGDEVCCSILRRKKSTKIGKGWKTFVDMNEFEPEEKLNFKFVDKASNNVMKVIILKR